MTEDARLSPHREFGRLRACAGGAAMAIAGPAAATVSLEYGQDCHDAYLRACAAREAPHVRARKVSAIEETISFEAFAEAVQRTGGDLHPDAVWSTSLPAIVAACFGAAAGEE